MIINLNTHELVTADTIDRHIFICADEYYSFQKIKQLLIYPVFLSEVRSQTLSVTRLLNVWHQQKIVIADCEYKKKYTTMYRHQDLVKIDFSTIKSVFIDSSMSYHPQRHAKEAFDIATLHQVLFDKIEEFKREFIKVSAESNTLTYALISIPTAKAIKVK